METKIAELVHAWIQLKKLEIQSEEWLEEEPEHRQLRIDYLWLNVGIWSGIALGYNADDHKFDLDVFKKKESLQEYLQFKQKRICEILCREDVRTQTYEHQIVNGHFTKEDEQFVSYQLSVKDNKMELTSYKDELEEDRFAVDTPIGICDCNS